MSSFNEYKDKVMWALVAASLATLLSLAGWIARVVWVNSLSIADLPTESEVRRMVAEREDSYSRDAKMIAERFRSLEVAITQEGKRTDANTAALQELTLELTKLGVNRGN